MNKHTFGFFVAVITLCTPIVSNASGTRYSGTFNYHTFTPSATYFTGRSSAQIDHLCNTGEHAGTQDLEECGVRDFERASNAMDKAVSSVTRELKKSDAYLTSTAEPLSLPYFLKAQAAWLAFRDNSCYAEAYEGGERSLKYIEFWHCMAVQTDGRAKDLRKRRED